MSLEFNISASNDVSVVAFKGKIISESHLEQLNHHFKSGSASLHPNLVFDFSELTHINSSGINFIIRSLTRTRINNGDLVLCSTMGNVKTLFEIAKINEIFSVYPSVSDALNHFKK